MSQYIREIRSRRHADDAQQSHRRHRLQYGRPLRPVNVPGESHVTVGTLHANGSEKFFSPCDDCCSMG